MSIRSYHQICSVARALDLIGERWTMLIVRDLMIGPMRYSELLASLPGITTNLLAKRLRSLQDQGILEKIPPGTPAKGPQTSQSPETPQPSQTAPSPDSPLPTPRPPSSKNSLYALTDKGRALEPVLKALGEWGMTHGRPPQPDDQINPRWLLFFLRRLYQKPRRKALVELRIQDRAFQFQIGGPDLHILENSPLDPDLRVSGTAQAFIALFSRKQSLEDLRSSGALQLQGSPQAQKTFAQALGLHNPE